MIEKIVQPILEEMGLFKGTEVSAKEVFKKYLERCPKGVGPLGIFKGIVAHKLNIGVRTVHDGENQDFLFYSSPEDELFNYDPRMAKDRHIPL